jgi:hypothetical protein
VFDLEERPFTTTPIDSVSHDLEPSPFFGLSQGEIIYFEKEYPQVYNRPMIINGKATKQKEYVIPVIREFNGEKEDSLFSINFTNTRNAKGEFVHGIAKKGGVTARVKALCEMGAIIGGTPVPYDAASFTDGKRDYIDVPSEDGKTYKQSKVVAKEYVPIKQYVNPTDATQNVAQDVNTTDAAEA